MVWSERRSSGPPYILVVWPNPNRGPERSLISCKRVPNPIAVRPPTPGLVPDHRPHFSKYERMAGISNLAEGIVRLTNRPVVIQGSTRLRIRGSILPTYIVCTCEPAIEAVDGVGDNWIVRAEENLLRLKIRPEHARVGNRDDRGRWRSSSR